MKILTARSGPRTLIGLLAALGLVAALTMPAMASHVDPVFYGPDGDEVAEVTDEGNPSCAYLGFSDELKIDVGGIAAGTTETFSNEHGSISITASADLKTFSFADAEPPVDAVVIKAGNGANVYFYVPAEGSDEGLITPNNGGENQATLSHISVCFGEEAAESEAPASQPAESEPAESQPAESQPAESQPAESEEPEESELPIEESEQPAQSIREDTQGGNPTATPTGGSLPNTAMGDFSQIPATVLSLVLLGALAAMVYVRLARQR